MVDPGDETERLPGAGSRHHEDGTERRFDGEALLGKRVEIHEGNLDRSSPSCRFGAALVAAPATGGRVLHSGGRLCTRASPDETTAQPLRSDALEWPWVCSASPRDTTTCLPKRDRRSNRGGAPGTADAIAAAAWCATADAKRSRSRSSAGAAPIAARAPSGARAGSAARRRRASAFSTGLEVTDPGVGGIALILRHRAHESGIPLYDWSENDDRLRGWPTQPVSRFASSTLVDRL